MRSATDTPFSWPIIDKIHAVTTIAKLNILTEATILQTFDCNALSSLIRPANNENTFE